MQTSQKWNVTAKWIYTKIPTGVKRPSLLPNEIVIFVIRRLTREAFQSLWVNHLQARAECDLSGKFFIIPSMKTLNTIKKKRELWF